MGLRVPEIPDDYGFDADCLACHPAGETPNYVFVRFYGIQSCPGKFPPPNGYLFVCKQLVSDPCIWHGEIEIATGRWSCNYDADFPWGLERRSEVILSHVTPFEAAVFTSRSPGCSASHVNLQTNCTMGSGFDGSAVITIFIDPIIIFLTSHYHFCTIPGVFYERQDVGMDHTIYRIAHPIDHTNVMILCDREEFPSLLD